MNDAEELEFERRINNMHSLLKLSSELCRVLDLEIHPAELAVDMEKNLEASLKKHGIIED